MPANLFSFTRADVAATLLVIGYGGAAIVGLVLAVIDARTHRLPDRLTLPLFTALLVLLGAASITAHRPEPLRNALLGSATMVAGFGLLHLLNPHGLGLGDVKLAASIGLLTGWFGWQTLIVATVLPFALAAGSAGIMIARRRANRTTALAFGPWLVTGATLAIVFTRP